MRKITKISNLKLIESFCQVNYTKGFKYIDSAGEILNLYQKNDGTILYQMSPNQLIISDPVTGIQELRVANFDMWLHFIDPNNLGEIERLSSSEISKILPIIEVMKMSRIGWRNFFVLELDDSHKNKFEKIFETNGGKINAFSLTDEKEKTRLTMNVSMVIKNDRSKQPAALFDIDCSRRDNFSISEIKEKFEDLRKYINSDDVLKLVNAIVQKI